MTISSTIADGVQRTFSVPAYTGTPVVKVNGTVVTWTAQGNNNLVLNSVPAKDAVVTIEYTEQTFNKASSTTSPASNQTTPVITGISDYSDYFPFTPPRTRGLSLGGFPRQKTLFLPQNGNYTAANTNATVTLDYSDPFVGDTFQASNAGAGGAATNGQSLSMNLTASGSIAHVIPTAANAVAHDLTGHNVYITFKVISGGGFNMSGMAVRLFDTTTPNINGANYLNKTMTYPDYNRVRNGVWETFAFPIEAFSAVGTGANVAAITHASVRVATQSGAAQVLIGRVFVAPKTLSRGAVTIGFDDCRADTWVYGARYMNQRGMPGVLYPGAIASVIRGSVDQYQMNIDQLKKLQDYYGWQIAAQAWDSENPSDTLQDFSAKMSAMTAFYDANRFEGVADGSYFSNVSLGSTRDAVFRKAFRTMRSYQIYSATEMAGYNGECVPIADPYNMHGFGINLSSQLLSDITPIIDRVIARKTHLNLVFHESYSSTLFNGIIDYLDSKRDTVDVLTIDQLEFKARVGAYS